MQDGKRVGHAHGGNAQEHLTWDLLFGIYVEVIRLSLIRGATTMPKKEPLQALTAFQLIREPKLVVLVGEFQEVE